MLEHRDFGDLYRAAFAERDPERKLLLLHEVQSRLEQWASGPYAENPGNRMPGGRVLPRPISNPQGIRAA